MSIAIETVCIRDLSITEAVRDALSPTERLQHDIAVQLAGRNSVGGICSLPSPEAVGLFAERHAEAYAQLVDRVTIALVAGGIMYAEPELMLVPNECDQSIDGELVVATERAA
ncbi:MAG: hypothetical protein ABI602_02870 [Candidatus Saccharibacteria bacterium]